MLPILSSAGGIRPGTESPARRILLIAQNLRDLASREIEPKTEAARRLDEMVPTTGELTVLMSDRNPFVRSGATWWLRNITTELPKDTVSALQAAIYDPNAHVVQAALGTVGVLRLEAARDDVLACLEDASAGVVHGAVFALGRMGPAEIGARLVPLVDHEEGHLQLAAVQALTNLRYRPAIPALIARLQACKGQVRRARPQFELPRRVIQALVTLEAQEAVPVLTEMAANEIGLRGLAVQALIDLRAESAGPALLPLLNRLLQSSSEEKLCNSLLYLMTTIDYRFAMPDVRAFLAHKLAPVRCAALKAVCRWKDMDAVPAVREIAMTDGSAFVRPVAVTALVELLGAEALPDLGALADDANSLVRSAVAEGLGKIVPLPEGGQVSLARLVGDDAAVVDRTAQEGLARVATVVAEGESGWLPTVLRGQAAAGRAFLSCWRNELPAGPDAERDRIESALTVLLDVLSE